jgi:hypothetical protein
VEKTALINVETRHALSLPKTLHGTYAFRLPGDSPPNFALLRVLRVLRGSICF